MKVFIAGGSGAIGVPLVRRLLAAGHSVTALTKSPESGEHIRLLGATPAIANALDPDALARVVRDAAPTHVIHELTALPKDGPKRASDLDATNRLRIEGTRNLLRAAIDAGARRLVVGSFALLAGSDGATSRAEEAAAAVRSMESQVLEASRVGRIEGVILRYGLFYGPDNPATLRLLGMVRRRRLPAIKGDRGLLPYIHVDDAASATVRALDHGPGGRTYDIVDDRPVSFSEMVTTLARLSDAPPPFSVPPWVIRLAAPYMARLLSVRLPLSNADARMALDWRPQFPTVESGLGAILQRAA
jgi:nucleoside-diphosphate-sugar epimerase